MQGNLLMVSDFTICFILTFNSQISLIMSLRSVFFDVKEQYISLPVARG